MDHHDNAPGARGKTIRSCAWGVTAGTDHPPAGPAQGPEMVVKDHPPVAKAPQKTATKTTQLTQRTVCNRLAAGCGT